MFKLFCRPHTAVLLLPRDRPQLVLPVAVTGTYWASYPPDRNWAALVHDAVANGIGSAWDAAAPARLTPRPTTAAAHTAPMRLKLIISLPDLPLCIKTYDSRS